MTRRAWLAVVVLVAGPVFAAAPPKASPAPLPTSATIETDAGTIVLKLLPELAPKHVAHFAAVAQKGGFDGTTFHRVIARAIIQGGDPLSKDPKQDAKYGTGGLGLLKAEFSQRPMTRGTLAAVLQPNKPDSGGNQFFICLSDQPSLTGKYTIYGEVTSGMDVADEIGNTEVKGDKPVKRVTIRKVTVGAAAEGAPSASASPEARP